MVQRNGKWHKMSAQAVVSQLHTNAACGLTRKAARSRLRKLGPNTLFDVQKNGRWSVMKSILTDPSVLMLLFSVFLAVFFSKPAPVVSALVALVCGAVLVFRFVEMIVSLHRTVALYRVPSVYVLRDGRVFELSARSIVVGDILLLQKGDIVPADCRVLDTDGEVCTRLTFRDGKGKRTALEQIKRADLVYPYESRVFAPNCENILYGKSEIISGTVRAVVTEIGEHTYIGAMQKTPSIATEERLVLKKTVAGVFPYIRLYSLFLFILLIPMTVIGLLVAPDEFDALRTFLPMGILCGLGAQSLLLLYFHSILANGYMQCVKPDGAAAHRSVPKSVGAIEKLSEMTDLIVLGKCASSDGIMHLHRAATGGGEVSLEEENQPLLAPICEALELLFSAPAASLSESQQHCTIRDLEDPILREELRKISQYDLDILDIRLKRATAYYQSDRILLEVEFKDANVRYCFTDRANLLYSCTDYEQNGEMIPLDSLQRANLMRFLDASIREGGHPTIVFKQVGARAVLLGILSCREELQPFLPSVLEELEQSGVRVSFFLPQDDDQTVFYARAANLPDSICRISEAGGEDALTECFGDHRVFLGFSEKSIRALLHHYKQKGCRFAVLGSESEALAVQTEAELRLACDPLTGDLRRSNGVLQNTIPVESGFFDGQYSRSLSVHANLLLPRAAKKGGGLASFLHALSVSRGIRFRMRMFFRYEVGVQCLRVALIFFSAILGVGPISGAQLLWGGLLFDLIALLWILRVFIPQNQLRTQIPFDDAYAQKTLTDKRLCLPPILTAFSLCLYLFIFSCVGLVSATDAVSYLFLAMIALELILFYRTVFRNDVSFRFKKDIIPALAVALPPLVLLGLSFLIPSLNRACELASFSLVSAISLPLAPILYVVFYKIAPKIKFRRKSSNK